MWLRFAESLFCPTCRARLELTAIEQRSAEVAPEYLARGEQAGLTGSQLTAAVDAGLFTCHACRLWYPVLHGLPVLLPYSTPVHDEFLARYGQYVSRLGSGYDRPHQKPPAGEAFVQRSFSKEWLEYEYDGVLWAWTYAERESLFLAEMGREPPANVPGRFLEVGCGLGVVTEFAARHFPVDAVGVDLSLAAMRAARHYRDHPFLHFVQASLWRLPFAARSFDMVYSHGVLHHTWSTENAFTGIAHCCRPGGRTYVWVSGKAMIRESLSRRVAYGVEAVLRPILARLPAPLVSMLLVPFGLAYMAINGLHRLMGRPRQAYNFSRAMHAARDRLTPLYAHRHEEQEVATWFSRNGFDPVHRVTEEQVEPVFKELMRRGIGMRGVRFVSRAGGRGGAP